MKERYQRFDMAQKMDMFLINVTRGTIWHIFLSFIKSACVPRVKIEP